MIGLDTNILQGYCWLLNTFNPAAASTETTNDAYQEGDELFLFGFSRGAYTARSLAGLINCCGLIRREQLDAKPAETNSELVQRAWNLYRQSGASSDEAQTFLKKHAYRVKIRFIGVWDTVGALGIPTFQNQFTPFWAKKYQFHDTELGQAVEHAYHAVAIDEHRKDYEVTLWTKQHRGQTVEQRWFPGAHSNVGGGYDDDLLPDLSLHWMAKKAIKLGLKFMPNMRLGDASPSVATAELPHDFQLEGTEFMSPVRDSYAEFMFGLYRAVRLGRRFYRTLLVKGVNEQMDESVRLKLAKDPSYRPQNLTWAGNAANSVPAAG